MIAQSLYVPVPALSALPASPTLAAAQQFTVLADIAGLLRCDNDAVVGSGVRHIFADRPVPGLTCALGPGSTGEDAARLIGGLLISLPVSFTSVVHALTREQPHMDVIPGTQGYRELGGDDEGDAKLAAALGLCPGDRVWGRAARMLAGTGARGGPVTAAETVITVNPEMIPDGLIALMEGGWPAATALESAGARRVLPSVALSWPGDPGLVTDAVLAIGGRPAAVARECVPAQFLDQLAKGAAG